MARRKNIFVYLQGDDLTNPPFCLHLRPPFYRSLQIFLRLRNQGTKPKTLIPLNPSTIQRPAQPILHGKHKTSKPSESRFPTIFSAKKGWQKKRNGFRILHSPICRWFRGKKKATPPFNRIKQDHFFLGNFDTHPCIFIFLEPRRRKWKTFGPFFLSSSLSLLFSQLVWKGGFIRTAIFFSTSRGHMFRPFVPPVRALIWSRIGFSIASALLGFPSSVAIYNSRSRTYIALISVYERKSPCGSTSK